MHRRGFLTLVATAGTGLIAGCFGGSDDEWPSGVYATYDTGTVTVRNIDGRYRGSVTVVIARTRPQQYLGLSAAASLPTDAGMLFIFSRVAERTFVMREMDFGIDIIFADTDGTITTIHHAPAPDSTDDDRNHRYAGVGQYVLEVPFEWTRTHGVQRGDHLHIDE